MDAVATMSDSNDIPDDFVDDRDLSDDAMGYSAIRERLDEVFVEEHDVEKYGPDSGNLSVANFVWLTDLWSSATIEIEVDGGEKPVRLDAHPRDGVMAVEQTFPADAYGSAVYVDIDWSLKRALTDVADWESSRIVHDDMAGLFD